MDTIKISNWISEDSPFVVVSEEKLGGESIIYTATVVRELDGAY